MADKSTASTQAPPEEDQGLSVRWSGLSLIFDERTLNASVRRLVDWIPDLKDLQLRV